jgi:hypothetical protein
MTRSFRSPPWICAPGSTKPTQATLRSARDPCPHRPTKKTATHAELGSILYGAAPSALVAGIALTLLARPRRLLVTLADVVAATAGPIGWNAILHATHASEFFTDAPIRRSACALPVGRTPARACSRSPPP